MSGHITRRPYTPGLAVRTAILDARTRAPAAVVIHTTGAGIAKRVEPALDKAGKFADWRRKNPHVNTTFEAAMWVYRVANKDSAHYVVGQGGECAQTVPDDLIARHVGALNARPYWQADRRWATVGESWWHARWPKLRSPVDLAGGKLWEGHSCNGSSIGIEVAPPPLDPTGPWSPAAWKALGALVSELCLAWDIPCTRTHVLSHSDAHPIARSAHGAPWDPGPRSWSWERFCQETGAPF